MSEEKRVRRTPEQIAADLDVQIEKLKDSILELENKKAASATEFDNKIIPAYSCIFLCSISSIRISLNIPFLKVIFKIEHIICEGIHAGTYLLI